MSPRKRTSKAGRSLPKRATKKVTPKRSRSKSRAAKRAAPTKAALLEPLRKHAHKRKWQYEHPTSGDVQVQRGTWSPDQQYRPYPIGRPEWSPEGIKAIARDEERELIALQASEVQALRDLGMYEGEEPLTPDQAAYLQGDIDEDPGGWREGGEIEPLPTFDEVYDYIDALVEEYDMDAHELFEIAFGYVGSDQV